MESNDPHFYIEFDTKHPTKINLTRYILFHIIV